MGLRTTERPESAYTPLTWCYGTIGARWEKYRIRTMAAIRLTVYALDTHHSTRQPDERYLRSSRGGTYRCQQR